MEIIQIIKYVFFFCILIVAFLFEPTKGKRQISGYVLIAVFLIGSFLFEQSRNTSYQEVVADLIGEGETVEKIAVYAGSDLLDQKATFIIDDQDLLNRLIDIDIDLERRMGEHPKLLQYALIIKTNKDSYVVGFDTNTITIGVREYVAYGNPIYELIDEEKENFDWKIEEYSLVDSETGELIPIFSETETTKTP